MTTVKTPTALKAVAIVIPVVAATAAAVIGIGVLIGLSSWDLL
jgi:hypothetical protein